MMARPMIDIPDGTVIVASDGLRDQFAMAALTGLCARSEFYLSDHERLGCVSVVAFAVADQMLAARGGK